VLGGSVMYGGHFLDEKRELLKNAPKDVGDALLLIHHETSQYDLSAVDVFTVVLGQILQFEMGGYLLPDNTPQELHDEYLGKVVENNQTSMNMYQPYKFYLYPEINLNLLESIYIGVTQVSSRELACEDFQLSLKSAFVEFFQMVDQKLDAELESKRRPALPMAKND
jgi:hypothetical protein